VTERYLILEGRGASRWATGRPRTWAGRGVLIPPGVRQRITNLGDVDLIFLAICTPRFTLAGYEDVESG